MKIKKRISILYELEGPIDTVINKLKQIEEAHIKRGFRELVIEEECDRYDEGTDYVLYGTREETSRERQIREGKELVEKKKQKEAEIAMLKSLRKRYPNE